MATNGVLDAIGDGTRRAVLESLRDGPQAVSDIARGLPVSRPAVSQHLKILKEARLVMDRPEGNKRIYRLDPYGLAELHKYIEDFWGHALARFKEEAER